MTRGQRRLLWAVAAVALALGLGGLASTGYYEAGDWLMRVYVPLAGAAIAAYLAMRK